MMMVLKGWEWLVKGEQSNALSLVLKWQKWDRAQRTCHACLWLMCLCSLWSEKWIEGHRNAIGIFIFFVIQLPLILFSVSVTLSGKKKKKKEYIKLPLHPKCERKERSFLFTNWNLWQQQKQFFTQIYLLKDFPKNAPRWMDSYNVPHLLLLFSSVFVMISTWDITMSYY